MTADEATSGEVQGEGDKNAASSEATAEPHALETDTLQDVSRAISKDSLHQATTTNYTPVGSLVHIPQDKLGMESGPPLLPEKDYDSPLDLPPRDYPTSSDHADRTQDCLTSPGHVKQTGDFISDDDYYAQMMNILNH